MWTRYLLSIGLAALFMLPSTLEAQSGDPLSYKGRFWLIWGYNRSHYTESDIHLTGPGYDFTLHDVPAIDDPEEFAFDVYVNPLKLTVPQFNFRMGYQFHERWALSLGWDHMKYVLDNGQMASISGTISEEVSGTYAGTYNNDPIKLDTWLLMYEHTDGLNYLRFNLDRFDPLWRHSSGKYGLYVQSGVGAGAMLPWTDTRLFNVRHRQWLHLAGWGVSANAGLRGVFFKRFFAQATVMGGHINLSDVLLTEDKLGRATQKFNFVEWHISGGVYLNLRRLFNGADCPDCPTWD